MNDLTEPLVGTPALDSDVLEQIRSVLTNAGITVETLGLPIGGAPDTSIISEPLIHDDADVEQEKTSSSWVKNQLTKRARRNRQSFTSEYPIAEDMSNMFWLSENWTGPFYYSILNGINKFALYSIVLYWLFMPGGFRDTQKTRGEAPNVVKAAQLLLIPVSIGITQEIMITCSLLSKMGYAPIPGRPQATRTKFHIANTIRFLDGICWLLIISVLMMYAVDVLEMFLNFAALQFLQSVDDAAYTLAQEGYLTWKLELVTGWVSTSRLPSKKGTWREYTDTMILGTIFMLMIIQWALVNFTDH